MDPEFGALTDTSEATIRDSLELNLTSHILLTRAFLPMLGARPSDTPMLGARPSDTAGDRSITLVSSINALRDYGLPAYSALHLRVIDEIRDRRRANPFAALVRLETRLEAIP